MIVNKEILFIASILSFFRLSNAKKPAYISISEVGENLRFPSIYYIITFTLLILFRVEIQAQNTIVIGDATFSITANSNASSVWLQGVENLPSSDKLRIDLKSFYNLPSEYEFRLRDKKIDTQGFTHSKLDQYYKNIKIEGASVIIHEKDGKVQSLNGYLNVMEDLNH